MPSRKQRRRREKTFRHDYAIVDVDEEGNEVEVSASELRAKKDKPEKAKAKSASQPRGRGGRAGREPQPPSWSRSFRRGALWGGVMLAVVIVFLSGPLAARVVWGLLYALAFIPLTYLIDRTMYRNWQRRQERERAAR